MILEKKETYYAPAPRAALDVVREQRAILQNQSLIRLVLDALPDGVLVLNQERQILMGNRSVLEQMRIKDEHPLIGFRLGEALDCIHAGEGPGGCGTSEACGTCGTAQAIMESLKQGVGRRECRITTKTDLADSSLELNVWSTKLEVEENQFLIFAFSDNSHEKRRRVLERLFFHDILNTAGGIRGMAGLIREESAEGDLGDLAKTIYESSDALINEIQTHRQLLAAEHNELSVQTVPFGAWHFAQELVCRFSRQELALDKKLVVDEFFFDTQVETDPVLLGRVMVNMIKNALEASKPGDTIRLGGRSLDGGIELSVNNPAVIPRDIQLQIFQRSFSTKGPGRGIGTYSQKLLGERYLKGRVSFSSQEEEGTTFRIWLPLLHPQD